MRCAIVGAFLDDRLARQRNGRVTARAVPVVPLRLLAACSEQGQAAHRRLRLVIAEQPVRERPLLRLQRPVRMGLEQSDQRDGPIARRGVDERVIKPINDARRRVFH